MLTLLDQEVKVSNFPSSLLCSIKEILFLVLLEGKKCNYTLLDPTLMKGFEWMDETKEENEGKVQTQPSIYLVLKIFIYLPC